MGGETHTVKLAPNANLDLMELHNNVKLAPNVKIIGGGIGNIGEPHKYKGEDFKGPSFKLIEPIPGPRLDLNLMELLSHSDEA